MQEQIVLGMGCFWGAERRLLQTHGVIEVESGYSNGESEYTNYETVLDLERLIKAGLCQTINHAEVIKVTFETEQTQLENILIAFWENHNPTQGNRQGNDIGTNYRSAIYTFNDEQLVIAKRSAAVYQTALTQAGYGKITTDIAPLFHYNKAEEYHQKYLIKHPNGYCGLGGTGVKFPQQACA